MSILTFKASVSEPQKKYDINGTVYEVNAQQLADNNILNAIYREQNINYPKFFKMDEMCKAGFLAVELAMRALTVTIDRKNTGVVFFSNAGSDVADRNFERTISDPDNFYPSPSVFVYTLPNIITGEICIRHGLMGESAFYDLADDAADEINTMISNMLMCHSSVVCGYTRLSDEGISSMVNIFVKDENES